MTVGNTHTLSTKLFFLGFCYDFPFSSQTLTGFLENKEQTTYFSALFFFSLTRTHVYIREKENIVFCYQG